MKEKLKQSFKPTPERFRYTVSAALDEATASEPRKKRIPHGWRIVIAVVVIVALIPSAIFGASKLYELIARPVDNYGLEIGVEREEKAEYPEYVKMHVETPEGFAEVPNTDGLKYYSLSAKEPYTDGFSLYPMRFYDALDMKEYIGNVDSYEERTMNGHQAYEIKRSNGGWDRLYIYYEDVNVFLLIYHKDVTDAQLESFVSGITFTEGTADDFTYLSTPSDERPQDGEEYTYEQNNIEFPRDEKITYEGYSELENDFSLRYTAQITGVHTVTDINSLDKANFNDLYDIDEITDADGNLLPRTVTVTKFGNGFNTKDEVLSTEEAKQVLVLADITYENLSDEEITVSIPWRLDTFNKNADGSFTYSTIIDEENDIHASDYCDSEIFYLTPHGEGKSFYTLPNLPAHGTATVTVGFRCNADKLDQAYLTLYGADGVVDPQPATDNPYTNYLFKVQ